MVHKLIPLILLFVSVAVLSFIGYAVYITFAGIAEQTSAKMERKNLVVSKDGVKVTVRNVKNEDYVGETQSLLVKAWNFSTWPAYRSRLWNKDASSEDDSTPSSKPRSRHSSNARNPSVSASASGSSSSSASTSRR